MDEIKSVTHEEVKEVEALVVNNETAIIPLRHYRELVEADVKLRMVKEMYMTQDSYSYVKVLMLMFGEKPCQSEEV